MATITFFTRTTKNTNPDKKINIRVRFRHGKEINLYAKSGLELLPHQFSNETHNVNKQSKYKDKYKDKKYLDDLEAAILGAYKNIKDIPASDWLNTTIDKFRFPDKYKKKVDTLFEFISIYIEKAKKRRNHKTDELLNVRTIYEYGSTFNYLQQYAKESGKQIDFKDIDSDFYLDFVSFLENRNLSLNTIGKKIKSLKVFLNDATIKGKNTNLAYKHKEFKILKQESNSIYLSIQELEQIQNIDL